MSAYSTGQWAVRVRGGEFGRIDVGVCSIGRPDSADLEHERKQQSRLPAEGNSRLAGPERLRRLPRSWIPGSVRLLVSRGSFASGVAHQVHPWTMECITLIGSFIFILQFKQQLALDRAA